MLPTRVRPLPRPARTLLLLALPLLLAVGCGGSGGGGLPQDVDGFINGLPSWDTLSPLADENNGVPLDAEPEAVEEVGPDNQLYTCIQRPYSITRNPEEIALANPDINIMWPGALIHGDSHLQPGSLRLLAIDAGNRAELTVSAAGGGLLGVPAGISRSVPNPAPSSVREAINDIIVGAIDSDVAIGAGRSSFKSSRSSSANQAMLEVGFSARYLGASAEGSMNYSRSVNRTTYTASFVQNLFTIAADPPERPSDFFAEGFGAAELRQLGVDSDNLPLYVESVSYGRIVMFTFSSTYERSRIEAALEFAYDGVAAAGSAYGETELQNTLNEAEITAFVIGGPNAGLEALIESADLEAYFNEELQINQVEPISFTLKTLAGNRTAAVSNTYEYTVEECLPRRASPPILDFAEEIVTRGMPIETPYDTAIGDVNDDDRADLIFNHLRSSNEVMVALGTAEGGFELLDDAGTARYLVSHPERVAEGWSNYELRVADVNGDELDDLVWNYRDSVAGEGFNVTYVALAQTDASGEFTGFDFGARQRHPVQGGGWELYDLLVGDVTGDGADDLVWNITARNTTNRTYTAVAQGDGSFTFPAPTDIPAPGWDFYTAVLGYVDSDLALDLMWVQGNAVHRSTSDRDGSFTHLGFTRVPQSLTNCSSSGEGGFLAGQIDEDVTTDLVRSDLGCDGSDAQAFYGDGDGGFTPTSAVRSEDMEKIWARFTPYLADFNGDGQEDLLYDGIADDNTTVKRVYVALATDDGLRPFNFSPARQDHFARPDWTQYDLLVGDVNGDDFDDVVWVLESATSSIFVGLAKDR